MAAANLSLLTSITRRAPFNTFRLGVGGQLGDSISVHCKICHRIIAVERVLNWWLVVSPAAIDLYLSIL